MRRKTAYERAYARVRVALLTEETRTTILDHRGRPMTLEAIEGSIEVPDKPAGAPPHDCPYHAPGTCAIACFPSCPCRAPAVTDDEVGGTVVTGWTDAEREGSIDETQAAWRAERPEGGCICAGEDGEPDCPTHGTS